MQHSCVDAVIQRGMIRAKSLPELVRMADKLKSIR
jgi:hypothetical protein